MIAEIGTVVQLVKEAGSIIERVSKSKEEANQPLLLASFDCVRDGCKTGFYNISMDIINNSGKNLFAVAVSVVQDGKVIPLINEMVMQKDGHVSKQILRAIVLISGDFSISSINRGVSVYPKSTLRVQIDDIYYDINIDFGIVINNVVRIKI